jgi:ubiquinone/menaquinone biosynthesis C-methylase UbiE
MTSKSAAAPNYDLSNIQVKSEEIIERASDVFVGPLFFSPIEDRCKSGIRVLNLGWAAGIWTAKMAKMYPNCTFDFLHKDNLYPTQNAPAAVKFHQVDHSTEKLPFADATFDYVSIRYILQTVPAAQWNHVLDEATRVLKPGCYLEVSEVDYVMYPEEGSNHALDEAVKKSFGAAGMHQIMISEVKKQLERLGVTKVSEKTAKWYINSEEFGPEFLNAMDYPFAKIRETALKHHTIEGPEYDKIIAGVKAEAHALKTYFVSCSYVARKNERST